MDIIERLAQQAAETLNGGEFNDGKWYTEGQRQAWRKAMTPVAQEIERLRQQNERMKETLQNIASVLDDENSDYQKWALYCGDIASLCLEDIAEATGGE